MCSYQPAPGAPTTLSIETPEHGAIGAIRLKDGGRFAELGYWLERGHDGQPYAVDALRAAVERARARWGRKVLVTGHFEHDEAAGEALHRCGFLYTGDIELRRTLKGDPAPMRRMVWIA